MEITIEYRGVEFDVEFDYQPKEAEVTYYSDGSGYPGCGAEIQINEIKHNGTCFLELMEEHDKDVCRIILEKMKE